MQKVVWLTKAAEQGLIRARVAQYSLGHSYMVGTEENAKDLQLARYWLEKAASQHLSEAATALATIPSNN